MLAPTHTTTRTFAAATVAVLLVITLVACTVGPPTGPHAPAAGAPWPDPPSHDPALVSRSILPPGNGGISGPTSVHLDDQRTMYDRLDDVVADGTFDDSDLGSYFKDAGLGTEPTVRTDTPAPGVRIDWDRYGVPRISGTTVEQVSWGAGWAVADSRLLIAEIGRVLGRAGTIEMGGSDDLVKALQHAGDVPRIDYTDDELLAGLNDTVAQAGADGPRILAALDGFVDGINGWLDTHTFPKELQALGLQWRHWTRADVLAVGVVVDDIFGSGGGDEVGNATALRDLVSRLGTSQGRAMFDRLRTADDPGATAEVDQRFPYPVYASAAGGPTTDVGTVDPAAVAMPDPGTTAAGPMTTPTMSNYMALAGDRTASGHPILVGGPQSSYFAPELLFEMELHGGGFDARGITFPGLGPWVVIGRSRTYAWTATAGGSDLTDERIEQLCEPDGAAPTRTSTHYVFDGRCVAMTRPDTDPMTAWRTVHGPVVGRTTVGGLPVAISRQRMSRFQTAHAALAFWRLNRGDVHGPEDFAPTMSNVPMSFNWAYVDAHHVATFHSGWYPIRAEGVDPDLPSWGTGQWEWRGRLDWHEQPQAIDPPRGYAVSWNNHVAPGWREPDNDWDSGVVQRVDLLDRRAAALHDATPADVVRAVQDAATVDVRGALVLPDVLRILDGAPAPNATLAATRDELARWVDAGAHRRDRNDDGWYDDHAVAVMDVLFEPLVDAVFRPTLGTYLDRDDVRRPKTIDNPPSQTGGAFAHGWYSAVTSDLRRAETGDPAAPAVCGGGDLATCRAALWHALTQAKDRSGPLPMLAVLERIRFLPYLFDLQSMRWQNRPTYQQVISFGDA
jgi:acyl-homoserine lactone acylase PvdQ